MFLIHDYIQEAPSSESNINSSLSTRKQKKEEKSNLGKRVSLFDELASLNKCFE